MIEIKNIWVDIFERKECNVCLEKVSNSYLYEVNFNSKFGNSIAVKLCDNCLDDMKEKLENY